MNVSKREQRVLHALAQGGHFRHFRDSRGHIHAVDCMTREGYRLTDGTLELFALRRRGMIASSGGGPYQITRLGLEAVRAQLDNR